MLLNKMTKLLFVFALSFCSVACVSRSRDGSTVYRNGHITIDCSKISKRPEDSELVATNEVDWAAVQKVAAVSGTYLFLAPFYFARLCAKR